MLWKAYEKKHLDDHANPMESCSWKKIENRKNICWCWRIVQSHWHEWRLVNQTLWLITTTYSQIIITKKKTFATFSIKLFMFKTLGTCAKYAFPKLRVSDKRFCRSLHASKWCDAIEKMSSILIEYVDYSVNNFST